MTEFTLDQIPIGQNIHVTLDAVAANWPTRLGVTKVTLTGRLGGRNAREFTVGGWLLHRAHLLAVTPAGIAVPCWDLPAVPAALSSRVRIVEPDEVPADVWDDLVAWDIATNYRMEGPRPVHLPDALIDALAGSGIAA